MSGRNGMKNGTAVAAAPAAGIILDRAALLGAALNTEDVSVPELGGLVRIREMTAGEMIGLAGAENSGVLMVVKSVIDASGKRMFDDADTGLIDGLSSRAVGRLVAAILKINRQTKASAADLEKN